MEKSIHRCNDACIDSSKSTRPQFPTPLHSRLAMLATAGLATQEYLTGQGAVEQLLSGHISPFGDGQGAF